MAFRIALSGVANQGESVFSSARRLPKELKMAELARRIGGRPLVIDESPVDLDELKARFVSAVHTNTLKNVPAQLWDRVPAVLWYGDAPHLGDMSAILDGLRAHLAARRANRCLRRMMSCYFRAFQPANTRFCEFAELITQALWSRHGHSAWLHLQETYRLFSPSEGPGAVAHYCLGGKANVQDALDEIGLADTVLGTRFGLASLYAALWRFSDTVKSGDQPHLAAMKIGEWIALRHAAVPFEIEVQVNIAKALLSPWDSSQPHDAVRKRLVEILLQYVGDPRRGDAVWLLPQTAAVKPRLLGWLAYGTIEQFFAVIDASAQERHWGDRRAFWASYAEKGVVTDAWVAYGPKALRLAKSAYAHGGYGELSGAREKDHSVLLLRIGTLIIADYSHNGSCRFFAADSKYRPDFYVDSYSDERLRWEASHDIAHHVGWQSRFAYYIYRQTGIRSSYESRW